MFKILFFIAVFLLRENLAQTPCNNIWQYIIGNDQFTQGLLTIYPKNYQQHNIKVWLSVGARLPSRYVGDINLYKDQQSTLNDFASGRPILLRVRFPLQNPLPQLITVHYNNEQICSSQNSQQNYGYVTTIQLDFSLSTPLQQQQVNRQPAYQSEYVQQPAYSPQPVQAQTQAPLSYRVISSTTRATRKPQTQASYELGTHSEKVNELNALCGVQMNKRTDYTGLVVHGYAAMKGQFPWLAAFFYNGYGDSGFICGGSLISTKLVITAAHCIQEKRSDFQRKAEESFFHLGKHHQEKIYERDVIQSGVSKFIIHPSYSSKVESYDADIAIAVLLRTITFTRFIQPICIWTYSTSYADLINKKGVVAGWGKTEYSISASDKPRWAELPVVDRATCLRSNSIFSKITSPRTFCVGSRDGRGPCDGDSGGGFILNYGGKYYLRGIVSSALFDQDLYMCDTTNYAVFTDVAQFKEWILQKVDFYG